jgi:EAL domain-containing protein (putative c-di-GMP-specific phosphodiesterase class I)/FixJ family two-component response regulator
MLSRFSDSRVVIVGGAVQDVRLLDALLRRSGLKHIHPLTDPRTAPASIAQLDPDLVVLDIQVREVDGFALLDEIVRDAAGDYRPVLVLTGHLDAHASSRALALGAKDFLAKPVDAGDVLLRVGNLLETRLLHLELRRTSSVLADELHERHSNQNRPAAEDHQTGDEAKHALVASAFAPGAMTMVFQPIIELSQVRTIGYEALARFCVEPVRTPDRWFADAADVGLGDALEVAAVSKALESLPRMTPGDVFLAINVSPGTLLHRGLLDLMTENVASRVVLELTEHHQIEDYGPVLDALGALRERGVRIGVDDTGAGFSSLRHILALTPDIIKLDMSLVRDIDQDPARRALAASMAAFAADTGAQLIAEGVETAEELLALVALGVRYAQGYHLGRPADPSVMPSRLVTEDS